MEYDVLGYLRVRHGTQELAIRRGRPRALLLCLLIADGSAVSADVLVDRLWHDHPPDNPHNALQTLVSYLRRTLGAGGENRIETRATGYALTVDPTAVDARRFERIVVESQRLAGAGTRSALLEAASSLRDGLALWQGEPLADISGEDYARGEITRLDELRTVAQELRVDVLLRLGRHGEAVTELRGLIATYPLREHLHELLMVGLYRSGRQAEALQVYQNARRVLAGELGIDPGPGLTRTEQLVLGQDPSLDWSPPPEPLTPEASGTGEVARAVPRVQRPPAPPRAVPSIPVEVTPLLGREDEVGHVRDLLGRARVVTLTGPGGTGKTRVAVEVARREGTDSDGGVWFVDLSAVSGDGDVGTATAAGLGVATRPDQDPLDAIVAAAPTGLLVLDTCEHVVAGAARLASRVLRGCAGMRILATSRRPLQINGEMTWSVPPLGLPGPGVRSPGDLAGAASVQLFVERASAVRSGMRLTAANAADIAALCVALDGLPLAIELAAAQSDVLSPAALLDRLAARFDLLSGGSRDAADRQRGLRATIDWSVQLLDPAQARFFGRLAVFPATFDMSAAGHVAGMGETAGVKLLTSLVRHSLVRALDGDRYQLLDSLRAYAAELLACDEECGEVRLRHLDYYVRLAQLGDELVRTPAQAEWWARLRAEIPNFRAALEWSLEGAGDEHLGARLASWTAWLWTHEGMLREADRWLTHAACVQSADPATRANVLIHVAIYSSPMGRLDRARAAADEAVRLARTAGEETLAGVALIERGIAEWAMGDLEAAAQTHDDAVVALRAGGYHWGVALARVLRSRTAIDAGDPGAQAMADRAVESARATADRHLLGVALQQSALLELDAGRLDEADAAARESLALEEAVSYREGVIGALHILGRVALSRGETGRAYRLFRDCLDRAHRIEHLAAVCQALEWLAETLLRCDSVEAAGDLLDLAGHLRDRGKLPPRRPEEARVRNLWARVGPGAGRQSTGRRRPFAGVDDALRCLPSHLA